MRRAGVSLAGVSVGASPNFTPSQEGLFVATLLVGDSRHAFDDVQTTVSATLCPIQLSLADTVLSGTAVYEAAQSITAERVTVATGANVDFVTGQSVVLGDGFEVESGVEFSIAIVSFVDCDP